MSETATKNTKVKKNAKANAGKYSYAYTDLAAIHSALEEQGITYYQYTEYNENAQADYIYTVIIKDEKELAARRGCKVIVGDNPNPAQAQGSGLTYARRYSLLMALGWATEDDDGASVQNTTRPSRNVGWRDSQGRPRQGSAAKQGFDFEDIKNQIGIIDDAESLRAEWLKLVAETKPTSGQLKVLGEIFKHRREEIEGETSDGK